MSMCYVGTEASRQMRKSMEALEILTKPIVAKDNNYSHPYADLLCIQNAAQDLLAAANIVISCEKAKRAAMEEK